MFTAAHLYSPLSILEKKLHIDIRKYHYRVLIQSCEKVMTPL